MKSLVEWKDSANRKPLMLYGARQVGKTYVLKEFGNREFENMVYINCYRNEAMEVLFAQDVNVDRILVGLSAISEEEIIPQKTFIFLDEVQEIPAVVASLKYFYEERPDICIAVAGSLLGVLDMKNISFPTGKVNILHMYPMTFSEFLDSMGQTQKLNLLRSGGNQSLLNSLIPEYVNLLRQYYFVGGMPEAVNAYVERHSPIEVRKIQHEILEAYEADIAKHAGSDAPRARMIFNIIPTQLAKENKKFIFGAIKKGARAKEYENAIQWLVDAGLVYKVCRVNKVASPLKFYIEPDIFKLYVLDVGLLGAMVNASPAMMMIDNSVFSEYKGAFSENYVLTQLITIPDIVISYYSKENSRMELDFVVEYNDNLYPIEVKAEENVNAKSLRQFVTVDNAGSDLVGIRYSMKGYDNQEWLVNIPLFDVDAFKKIQSCVK